MASQPYITENFVLSEKNEEKLRSVLEPRLKEGSLFGMGAISEAVYFRTYSRQKPDGSQENWVDTVLRVVNGLFSILKTHFVQHRLTWQEDAWQTWAYKVGKYIGLLRVLPPGRGLWAMGTKIIERNGATSLYNCGAVTSRDLLFAATWMMDCLMSGVGVGSDTEWDGIAYPPIDNSSGSQETWVIEDSREGWVDSVRRLLNVWLVDNSKGQTPDERPSMPVFDYSQIRPLGTPLKTFGGVACGPQPLIDLHKRLIQVMTDYLNGTKTRTQTVADVINSIGACVVAGNIRRSAQILLGSPDDEVFRDLKNPAKYPDRSDIAWMSNNSIVLSKSEQFTEHISAISENIRLNGEPGIINLINVQKYGRIGEQKHDDATLVNPCSEINLESCEVCNLAEVFPFRCTSKQYFKALDVATFYTTTVTLLPTHIPETNRVVARNRRIGVSMSGLAQWKDAIGSTMFTRMCRDGYQRVVATNAKYARMFGIPASIRVSTVKPSGSISLLTGATPGMHYPPFKYFIRRMRMAKGGKNSVFRAIARAGYPWEDHIVDPGDEKSGRPRKYDTNTAIFEFPGKYECSRTAEEVSMWEQFGFLSQLQREWADNSVSVTITFNPETEGHQIEHALGMFLPQIKSVSMLPHTPAGSYLQMPYEGITEEEYNLRIQAVKQIDWSQVSASDGVEEKFCTNDTCAM